MDEAEQVGAEIQHGPAGKLSPVDAVVGGEPLAEVGDHRRDIAQSAGVENLAQDIELWQECGPVGLHAEQAAASGLIRDALTLSCVECKWLLDQYVLIGPQR